jgi:putative dimethyl sulfoxide reductase chaperone
MKEMTQKIAPEEDCCSDEFAQILCAREGFYGFLAQCYLAEPSMDFLYELDAQLETLGKYKLYQKGAGLLSSFFEESDGRLQTRHQDLVKEFAYLFLAPGAHRVHPYESIHRSKKRLLKQEPYDLVVQAFRASGLGKQKDCKELEDHIALEFEYMEITCAEARFALESNNNNKVRELLDKQRLFLVRHILRWVPEFCKSVYRESKTQFYQGIALLTDAFISSERAQIEMLKNRLGY